MKSSNTTSESASLTNIVVNVLIPVLALNVLSKDEGGFLHFGPMNGMIIAVAFPLVYGVWDLLATKKVNTFSVLGLVSVLLTGGLTLYLWNEDGSVKENAPLVFSTKEALVPLILGSVIIIGGTGKDSLFRLFLYNDAIFNIPSIEEKVEADKLAEGYSKVLSFGAFLFASSFLVSALLNFILSFYFLIQVDYSLVSAKVEYNDAIGKITGYGYLLIGLPLMAFTFGAVYIMTQRLKALTQLPKDKISFVGL